MDWRVETHVYEYTSHLGKYDFIISCTTGYANEFNEIIIHTR